MQQLREDDKKKRRKAAKTPARGDKGGSSTAGGASNNKTKPDDSQQRYRCSEERAGRTDGGAGQSKTVIGAGQTGGRLAEVKGRRWRRRRRGRPRLSRIPRQKCLPRRPTGTPRARTLVPPSSPWMVAVFRPCNTWQSGIDKSLRSDRSGQRGARVARHLSLLVDSRTVEDRRGQ